MSLDRSKFDKISEVLSDAVGSALDALSPILGADLNAQPQPAQIHTIKDTDYSGVMPAMYFNIVFVGDISGKAVAVFREIDLAVILSRKEETASLLLKKGADPVFRDRFKGHRNIRFFSSANNSRLCHVVLITVIGI